MKNPLRKMSADALYAQLGILIASAPNLKTVPAGTRPGQIPPLTGDQMLWLGRAEALVTEVFGAPSALEWARSGKISKTTVQ